MPGPPLPLPPISKLLEYRESTMLLFFVPFPTTSPLSQTENHSGSHPSSSHGGTKPTLAAFFPFSPRESHRQVGEPPNKKVPLPLVNIHHIKYWPILYSQIASPFPPISPPFLSRIVCMGARIRKQPSNCCGDETPPGPPLASFLFPIQLYSTPFFLLVISSFPPRLLTAPFRPDFCS